MKKIKDIFNKIKDKKINYDKWFVRVSVITEVVFIILALTIYFTVQDLYDKYNHIKVDVYEIKEEIK